MLSRIKSHLRARAQAKEIARFFALPHAERVRTIQSLYAMGGNRERFDRYFAEGAALLEAMPIGFLELVEAYTRALPARAVHQIGCFTASECRFLADRGYDGALVASDYDGERLDYLRGRFAGGPYARIDLRRLDLEAASAVDFAGQDMVVAHAVLSNVQPEALPRLYGAFRDAGVKLVAFSDVYTPRSLAESNPAASTPSNADRNWFHPYLALAGAADFETLIVPDLSSHGIPRATFVAYRGVSDAMHEAVLGRAAMAFAKRWPTVAKRLRSG